MGEEERVWLGWKAVCGWIRAVISECGDDRSCGAEGRETCNCWKLFTHDADGDAKFDGAGGCCCCCCCSGRGAGKKASGHVGNNDDVAPETLGAPSCLKCAKSRFVRASVPCNPTGSAPAKFANSADIELPPCMRPDCDDRDGSKRPFAAGRWSSRSFCSERSTDACFPNSWSGVDGPQTEVSSTMAMGGGMKKKRYGRRSM